jgi:beta-lactamase regulating signal transducer with metallopeptidase domain
MNTMELLTGSAAQALGWALLHLLWQATIVAGILAAVLALMPRQSANARYAAACGALGLVFALFVATAVRSYDPAAAPIPTTASETRADAVVPLAKVPVVIVVTAAEGWRDRALDLVTTARQSLPSVVALWLTGVVFLSSRLLVSWLRVRRLATHNTREAGSEWQDVAARLSVALGLRKTVRLLESAAVEVPSVLGTLKPVVLLPASALAGLTPQQMEMVLAHELAHIRRHDFLVNLLQAFVETLMFYHPAVWWMSSRVRIERENCCDDLAVAVCGSAVQYARALTRLEELRATALPVVVAADGGSLVDRIRRIAAGRSEGTGLASRWAAAAVMLTIVAVTLAVPSLPALAQREDAPSVPAVPAAPDVEAVPDTPPVPAVASVPAVPPAPAPRAVASARAFDHGVAVMPAPPAMPAAPRVAVPAPVVAFAPRVAVPAPSVPLVAPVPLTPLVPGVLPAAFAPPAPMAMAGLDLEYEYEYEHDADDGDETTVTDRKLSDGGKLTVDELITLSAVGVTPEYIRAMRAVFPDLTVRQVTSLKAMEVTPQYVADMRKAGLVVDSARDATSLKAVGVSASFVKEMRDAGFAVTDVRAATSLSAVGVTPAYVRDMRAAGFTIKNERDATRLKAVDVTPEWVRQMREAGVDPKTADEAASLRAVGVTPQFVRQLAAAGYANLSVRDLTKMAASGVDVDFIRDLEKYREKQ